MVGKLLNRLRYQLLGGLIPEGRLGIRLLGHRNYVGGKWDAIGDLQFNFMVEQGLIPTNCLLDIACGSLRGGVRFIKYLNAGNYLGLDKEESLLKTGVEKELGLKLFEEKRPQLIVSDRFEFTRCTRQPEYSLSVSLFTHLSPKDITLCLANLRAFVRPGHKYYTTFFEGASSRNPETSHSLDHFEYTRADLAKLGAAHSWQPNYIGDWNHPRDQKMMCFVAV